MTSGAEIPVWKPLVATPARPGARDEARVTVVGAGPVGLTLALDLAGKGEAVTVLGKLDFIPAGSRAICFSRRSLEIWNRLGVVEPMLERGIVWDVGKVFWRDRQEPIFRFDLRGDSARKMPGFINIQQYYVEETLIEAAQREPLIDLRLGHEAVEIAASNAGARIGVRAGEVAYEIETEWLVACDGSRSTVREALGLSFNGRAFEDHFLIADIRFRADFPAERWFWFDPPFNPGRSALLHKQPDDVWRLDFQLGPHIDRETALSRANVDRLVRSMIGDEIEFEPVWRSVYTFRCSRIDRFVHGRIVFAGDSAHLVSPFGARGCNGGVADADNLAWKLALVLSGESPPKLLSTYDDEAGATADVNILNSARSCEFMTPKGVVSQAFRDSVLSLASVCPFARPLVNSGRLSAAVAYPESPLNTPDSKSWKGGTPPGWPVADAPIGEGWLLDRLGDRFVLLTAGVPRVDYGGVDQLRLEDISDSTGVLRAHLCMEAGGACLIRPDHYMAARWPALSEEAVVGALSRAKGAEAAWAS